MDVRSQSRERILPRAWGVGLETAALAVGAVLLGMLIQPEDPFFTRNSFGWLALGPLLAGLRYGFASGLSCALLLVMMLLGHHQAGWATSTDFSAQFAFGVVVVGAVSGEVRDNWERERARGAAEGAWHRRRLEEFTRVYHLLRVSHEHLEQRLARGGGSLRLALAQLKEKAVRTEAGGARLEQLGGTVLELCATFCGVQAAALYGVNDADGVEERPAARLGDAPALSAGEPMVSKALATGEVVTLKEQPGPGALVAAIPLLDVSGQVHGVIAVHRMHFPAIQADTFRTLAVLGAHVGDLLAGPPGPGVRSGSSFLQALRRGLCDLRHHGLPASLVVITCHEERGLPALEKLAVHKRSLDEQWLTRNDRDEQVLVLLLPLTGAAGAQGCRDRLEKLLASSAYTFHVEPLGASDRAEEVLGRVVGRIHVESIPSARVVGPVAGDGELERTTPQA